MHQDLNKTKVVCTSFCIKLTVSKFKVSLNTEKGTWSQRAVTIEQMFKNNKIKQEFPAFPFCRGANKAKEDNRTEESIQPEGFGETHK